MPSDATLIDKTVTPLLHKELSLEAAISISLLCNHTLAALYQNVGIAQADVLQASLISNPLFNLSIGFPQDHKNATSSQISITQSFVDFILIPLRKKYASYSLKKTEWSVAHAIMHHIAQIEMSYYDIQAEVEKSKLLETLVAIEEAKTELSESQLEAGNVYQQDTVMKKLQLCDAKLNLAQSKSRIHILRIKLNELMGLEKKYTSWHIDSPLPAAKLDHKLPKNIEHLALQNRFDLKIAKMEVDKLAEALGLNNWWGNTQGQIGITRESDSEGSVSLGPTLQLALPLFDFGQAVNAKQHANLKQNIEMMLALSQQIRGEVLTAKAILEASQDVLAQYQHALTPLQLMSMDQTSKLYNVMGASSYALLNAKRDIFYLHIQHIEALHNYWNAYTRLKLAVNTKV